MTGAEENDERESDNEPIEAAKINIPQVNEDVCASPVSNNPVENNNHSNILLEGNCWHHLRAVWINATIDDLASYISRYLSAELKDIDARLRIKIKADSIILALHKCFAETENYVKGYGDAFKGHMKEFHPNRILHHAPTIKGNRQDVVCECEGPACTNRAFCIEFLDKKL